MNSFGIGIRFLLEGSRRLQFFGFQSVKMNLAVSSPPWPGKPVWKLGYNPEKWDAPADPKVLSTVLRDGNYDYVTKEVRWASNPKHLPDSLYLAAKPAFFGDKLWPWVDPTASRRLYTLPARARFDAIWPRQELSPNREGAAH